VEHKPSEYGKQLVAVRSSRRAALRGGLAAFGGLAAAAVIGCGDDEEATPEAPEQQRPGAGAAVETEPDYVRDAKADGAPFPYNYPEPAAQPKPGGTLIVGGGWTQAAWDPNKSQGGSSITTPNTAADRLLGLVTGPKMPKTKVDLQPELATSWEVSPDGLRYTFRLRDGVKFQNVEPVNGRPFVAKDVVSVYERQRTGVSRAMLSDVDRITAPDDRTVVIILKQPNADFLIPLATRLFPIYPIEVADKGLIDKVAIGTGPAIVTSADANGVRFKSNPDYWGGKPLLDGLEYRFVGDPATALAMFRSGQIHFGATLTSKADADRVLQSNPDTLIGCDPLVMQGNATYIFNTSNPKFADERVRRALSMGMDRKTLIQLLWQGYGKMVTVHGWPFVFDRHPTDAEFGPWWRFDAAEAKKMLAAAGYEKLEFELVTPAGRDPAFHSAVFDMWRPLNVSVRVSSLPYANQVELFQSKKYEEATQATPVGSYPAANNSFYDYMHSKSNYWRVDDPQIDQWAEQQRRELSPQARREILRKQWDRVQDRVFKIDSVDRFAIVGLNGAVRYARFNGPYFTNHTFYDWGSMYAKIWLNK